MGKQKVPATDVPPPLYSQECPKCGQAWVRVRYRAADPRQAPLWPEQLLLTCPRCGYAWSVPPKDAER